jgi:hypothetical protein
MSSPQQRVLEYVDDSADQLRKLLKRWNDRLTLEGLSLPERYLEGRLPHITLKVELAVHSYEIQYAAILDTESDTANCAANFAAGTNDPDVGCVNRCNSNDWKYEQVLVGNVQRVQCVNGIIPRKVRPNLVCDHIDDVRSTLQYSTTERSYKMIPVLVKPELGLVSGSAAGSSDQLNMSNIQSRPQVVDGVSNHEGEVPGRILELFELKNMLPGI